mmetsp:Transcript_4260/g.13508  ORF Transcript_4260/g.13508 Transcript_4260/m.13508 type:complete len:89 (-) Transcript_4260:455-721(-)
MQPFVSAHICWHAAESLAGLSTVPGMSRGSRVTPSSKQEPSAWVAPPPVLPVEAELAAAAAVEADFAAAEVAAGGAAVVGRKHPSCLL